MDGSSGSENHFLVDGLDMTSLKTSASRLRVSGRFSESLTPVSASPNIP